MPHQKTMIPRRLLPVDHRISTESRNVYFCMPSAKVQILPSNEAMSNKICKMKKIELLCELNCMCVGVCVCTCVCVRVCVCVCVC